MCSCVPVLRLDDTLTDISYLMFGGAMFVQSTQNDSVDLQLPSQPSWCYGYGECGDAIGFQLSLSPS